MHEAFWNGLFDVRWEEAPLGPEAIRLTVRLRERGYAERTCRDYGHVVVHLGRYLHEERESDQVRDEGVVADFLAGHLPGCRCYHGPVGHREEPVRRGLAHLLVHAVIPGGGQQVARSPLSNESYVKPWRAPDREVTGSATRLHIIPDST